MQRGNGHDIILQAFHWNLVKTRGTGTMDGREQSWYAVLREMAGDIRNAGFTIVYLPPCWRDDSDWEHNGRHGGGEGYFWHDFDLDSRYGTAQELKELVQELHSLDIKVIIDLVTNHRDRFRMQKDVWEYPGPCWARSSRDTGGTFMDGSCDLNLAEPRVHERFRQAMEELMVEYGVDGWRWDYVWGYEVDQVVSWIKGTSREEYISIGEYWQDSPNMTNDPMVQRYGADEGARIIGWARESGGCAFDIILKRQIQTANPANLQYGLNATVPAADRGMVVTFVDNHDMGASPFSRANGWGQQCWPCSPGFKSQAYAFIISMPGTPCVYWPDWFDWGHTAEINSLLAIRRDAGIVATSEWENLSGRYGGAAGIVCNHQGIASLAFSIGSYFNDPGAEWEKVLDKEGLYTIWRR